MTLLEFATLAKTHIVLNASKLWSARLEGCEIKDGCMLTSASGYGATARDALEELVYNIRGRRVVFEAYCSECRREFDVPETLERGDLT
jgi:hypothetical protein